MSSPQIVDAKMWKSAQEEFLKEEKAFMKQRDALAAKRRQLPWTKIEKDYTFHTPLGHKSLGDLFGKHSQLVVYHFMFGPDWQDGCKSCSYLCDSFDKAIAHLGARDVGFVAIGRAPIETLEAFRQKNGWDLPFASSENSSFNFDFHVSFDQDDIDAGNATYNYGPLKYPLTEAPGLSVFSKAQDGAIYRTFSTFARGLDRFITTYQLIDCTAKGRDEGSVEPHPMGWVRLKHEY